MVVSFVVELHYTKHGAVPLLTRLILLLLLNLTIMALFVLMFFVAKSLVKLYFERKHKVLGYKFKTKLVIILVVLTLIPSIPFVRHIQRSYHKLYRQMVLATDKTAAGKFDRDCKSGL